MSANHVSRVSRIKVRTMVALSTVIFMTGCASTGPTKVTLRDGKTYEIETARGLPVRFANDRIRVQDLGITARFKRDKPDAASFVRVLVAELTTRGRFAVTITTPLDSSASATLEATGPGRIVLHFFPQADYPLIWEGIDRPGVHWFPFHFVFEEKQSKYGAGEHTWFAWADKSGPKRFEFTQWAQMDDRTWKEARELVEELKRKIPSK